MAGAAMIVLAPLFGILALAVRLETRGPVFFKQRRVGRGGRPFWMVKFRSMHLDAEARRQAVREAAGAAGDLRFKMRGDPRITRVGRILRRLSLDELPQLLNVLRGEMSLVGPRPPIPEETARYSRHEWGRMAVTPGLTCLWQVRGRSDIPFDGQVELDLEYIKNRSFLRDLGILLQTIPAVLSGRGAY